MVTEIFNEILALVLKYTEITEEELFGNSKKVDTVDARTILIMLLIENGFYVNKIAEHIHKTSACVRVLVKESNNRQKNSKMISIILSKIRNELKNK